jgi:protoporphyrinogen oxidase
MRGEVDVLIVGGGLSGLSAAYHLRDLEIAVLEMEGRPGGLCKSRHIDGFTFDMAGHVLHIRDEELRTFIHSIMEGNLAYKKRRSFVFMKGRFIPYPFQMNFWMIPEIAEECMEGLVKAREKGGWEGEGGFEGWIKRNFGEGIARHFMIPYNRKLWRVPLSELTSEWAEGFIPVPEIEEIQKRIRRSDVGYNPVFYYPYRGGIEELVEGFLKFLRGKISVGTRLKEVIAEERLARTDSGDEIRYGVLISSVPLKSLMEMVVDAPEDLKALGKRLRATSVLCYNLGVRGKPIPEAHWIYFPEERFPFYRVGIPTNFAPHLAPDGYSSLYVEISFGEGERPGEGIFRSVVEGLEELGIIGGEGDIAVKDVIWIENAYCIYDEVRRKAVEEIIPYLEGKGIIPIGRYGRWEYSSMQDAIIQGREVGRRCFGR